MSDDPFLDLTIGQYQISKFIAESAMSRVYLASDLRLSRVVVVKFLTALSSGHALDRFQREIKTLATLDHECVPKIYGTGMTDGDQPYLVMEYCSGESLQHLIDRQGVLAPSLVTRIAIQTARALSAIHQVAIHRDIKPSNIIVDLNADPLGVKVTDMGIVHLQEQSITGTNEVICTLNYASPEHLNPRSLVPASDIFSLGCVMHACLTGEPPKRSADYCTVSIEKFPPEVPQSLTWCIEKTLRSDPAERFASALELIDALASADVPESADVPDPRARPGRKRNLIVVAGVFVILLSGAFFYLQSMRRESKTEDLFLVASIDRLGSAIASRNLPLALKQVDTLKVRDLNTNDRVQLASKMLLVSRLLVNNGQRDEACSMLLSSLDVLDKASYPREWCKQSLSLLTDLSIYSVPSRTRTIDRLQRLLDNVGEDRVLSAELCMFLGRLYYADSAGKKARECFEKSLVFADKSTDPLLRALTRTTYLYTVIDLDRQRQRKLFEETIDSLVMCPVETVDLAVLQSACTMMSLSTSVSPTTARTLVEFCRKVVNRPGISRSAARELRVVMYALVGAYDRSLALKELLVLFEEEKGVVDVVQRAQILTRIAQLESSPQLRLARLQAAVSVIESENKNNRNLDEPYTQTLMYLAREYSDQHNYHKALYGLEKAYVLRKQMPPLPGIPKLQLRLMLETAQAIAEIARKTGDKAKARKYDLQAHEYELELNALAQVDH